MENMVVQGFVLLDVDVVALNNAGKSTNTLNDNGVATKTIIKNGRRYVYVSGQAWRYWWREALQKNQAWKLSPITREAKIAFTNANPIEFADDDMFGYMRAATEKIKDEKGKEKSMNITVTRTSPLKNSAIVSVASTFPVENWSSMSRQEGEAVPYFKQEYSAIMKGMFSLDANMVGTFSNYNRTGYMNLSQKLREEAISKGAIEIEDPFVEKQKLIRLPKEVREKRIIDTIQALKYISGGAMQTNNMGDVTPKFIILATTNTGNHPFSHVAKSKGDRDDVACLDIEGIREVLNEYRDTFIGKVFIGKRTGFMDDHSDSLKALANEYEGLVIYGAVNEMIDAYCAQVQTQLS
ncbi:type I-B CRISPR-associated protein Cas7/Cst2/DevR [Bacteroides sp. 214]|uniref:type I-B CRISPR-associated protein Cas7/Cst2/DevR n=1 Tax=Bacteroides sp. 214 TaxID=2302935 RepID=UPI0013D77F47|nr:type I-B CRISPR-associated protein Cas7/Cst2/DevR [Bacteroides sp. 214]NDW13602.1 type I-B CRISPR-associated protein Cas7/Cst2/DevR [Bacteroides sp. 214]